MKTMDKAEALRSIYHEHLEYIQQKVRVDFDNSLQQPVTFVHKGKLHAINEVVCRFRMLADQPVYGYLIEDSESNVFFLYSQLKNLEHRNFIESGFWVLSFRIQNDDELMSWYREERRMLANITLKRVVNFHGHFCPDLAVGGKFCEYAQNLFNQGEIPINAFSVVAENTTSALDAIQVLLGATIGNQRLLVMDYGKHNYTLFSRPKNRGWKLKLKDISFDDEDLYQPLEKKISDNSAVFDDIVLFQQLIDARIRKIMSFEPNQLFLIEKTSQPPAPGESATVFVECWECGEQVIASRSIRYRQSVLCRPCFDKMSPGYNQ